MHKEGRETLIKFKIIQAYTDETLVKKLAKMYNDESIEVIELKYSTTPISLRGQGTDKISYTVLVGFKEKTDTKNILG